MARAVTVKLDDRRKSKNIKLFREVVPRDLVTIRSIGNCNYIQSDEFDILHKLNDTKEVCECGRSGKK